MSTFEIFLGIALIIFSVSIVLVVLMQEGHQNGVGVVTGGSDSFYSRHKSRSIDAFLERWTRFIAIGLFVLVIVTNAILFFC